MELSTIDQEEYASIGISHETTYADHTERSVRTYVPPIDALIGGLKPRTMTLIDSADRIVFGMVNMMSVNAVSENHDEVIWIDGGNSANPFELTAVCKRFRLSSDEVLSSVTISRAFTAYQMSTLIEDMLEKEVGRIRTGMVVITCFPDLFQDKDMEWSESFQLMRRSMEKLRELTEKHDLVTVITNFGLAKMFYRKGLRPLLYDGVDRVVRIENYGKASLRIMLPKENTGTLYRPVPRNQTTLDEFGGVTTGRTVPTYRMNAEGMINSWSDYRRALPIDDKVAFDSMCNRVRMHASAATYAAFTDPFESAVLSILLEQEKEILALRKSVVR